MTTTILTMPGLADRPSQPVPDYTIEDCYWCGRPGCQWCPANRCPDPLNQQCHCLSCAVEMTPAVTA